MASSKLRQSLYLHIIKHCVGGSHCPQSCFSFVKGGVFDGEVIIIVKAHLEVLTGCSNLQKVPFIGANPIGCSKSQNSRDSRDCFEKNNALALGIKPDAIIMIVVLIAEHQARCLISAEVGDSKIRPCLNIFQDAVIGEHDSIPLFLWDFTLMQDIGAGTRHWMRV